MRAVTMETGGSSAKLTCSGRRWLTACLQAHPQACRFFRRSQSGNHAAVRTRSALGRRSAPAFAARGRLVAYCSQACGAALRSPACPCGCRSRRLSGLLSPPAPACSTSNHRSGGSDVRYQSCACNCAKDREEVKAQQRTSAQSPSIHLARQT